MDSIVRGIPEQLPFIFCVDLLFKQSSHRGCLAPGEIALREALEPFKDFARHSWWTLVETGEQAHIVPPPVSPWLTPLLGHMGACRGGGGGAAGAVPGISRGAALLELVVTGIVVLIAISIH